MIQIKTKGLNFNLLICKTIVAIIIVIEVFISTKAKVEIAQGNNVSSDLSIYLEWIGTYTLGVYFYFMGKDVESFNF